MQFDNKIRMKIIIADRVMVIITVCHTSHNPLKVANGCITGSKKQSEERSALFAVRMNAIVMFIIYPGSQERSKSPKITGFRTNTD